MEVVKLTIHQFMIIIENVFMLVGTRRAEPKFCNGRGVGIEFDWLGVNHLSGRNNKRGSVNP